MMTSSLNDVLIKRFNFSNCYRKACVQKKKAALSSFFWHERRHDSCCAAVKRSSRSVLQLSYNNEREL